MLRMDLYYQEFGDLEPGGEGYQAALEKSDCNTLLGCCNPLPHRNAVESQGAKKAKLGRKSGMTNWIDIAA